MSLTLGYQSRPLWDGDSTDDITSQYQGWMELDLLFRAKTGCPYGIHKSVTGAQISTVAGTIAGYITTYRPTHVLLWIGINDSINSIADATSRANLVTYLNATTGAGIPCYVAGPLCAGELNPTGANGAVDGRIDTLDASMAQVCAGYSASLVTYRSLRAVWKTVEAAQNFVAQANPGPMTRPDSVGKDHPNPNGRHLITAAFLQDVVF